MAKLNDRAIANMEVALEDVCKRFPNGGDHESRKFIAHRLKLSARKGNVTLRELSAVAHSALQELSKPQDRLGNLPRTVAISASCGKESVAGRKRS